MVSGRHTLVITDEIWREYEECSSRPRAQRLFLRHGVSTDDYLELLDALGTTAESVSPTGEPPLCRDEKDRKYLHCAVYARVDALITADRDLLVLEQVEGIPILDAHAFLAAFPSD